LAQMFQGLAHRRAGNFDHALERVVHFQDNKRSRASLLRL
jgi:hypothetical protein